MKPEWRKIRGPRRRKRTGTRMEKGRWKRSVKRTGLRTGTRIVTRTKKAREYEKKYN